MLLGRWAMVKAQPKKAVSQISLAFEEPGWQDLQRSPLHSVLYGKDLWAPRAVLQIVLWKQIGVCHGVLKVTGCG
jgi:hypothetical protein